MSGFIIEGVVSPSDIADMAGVSRGAVSNWRKRADDFPLAVGGTEANPIFNREEVMCWLIVRGYEVAQPNPGEPVWSVANLLRRDLDSFELMNVILTLLAARKISLRGDETVWHKITQHPLDARVMNDVVRTELGSRQNIPDVEASVPGGLHPEVMASLLEKISRIDVADLSVAADYVVDRIVRAQGKLGADSGFVGSQVSLLLATLASARIHGGILYDPTCGFASTVTKTVELTGDPSRIIGQDISSSALRIAMLRSFLHDVKIELVKGDVLVEDLLPGLKADVIVAEPPFGARFDAPAALADIRFAYGTPPRISADLAWIQDAVAHLSENGRAYVVTTVGCLSSKGSEEGIRAGLVRSGCVEAVVALPGKMLPHTAVPLALWVLRPPTNYFDESIQFIDATEEKNPAEAVPTLLAEQEKTAFGMLRAFGGEVLAKNSNLNPLEWVLREPEAYDELGIDFDYSYHSVGSALQEIEELLLSLQNPIDQSQIRVVSMDELLNEGAAKLFPGREKASSDGNFPPDCVTRQHVDRGVPPQIYGLTSHKDGSTTEDVIVAMGPEPKALAVASGRYQVAAGLSLLSHINTNVLVPRFLAAMIGGPWNKPSRGSSFNLTGRIRDLVIPLPDNEEQTRLIEIIERAQTLKRLAAALTWDASSIHDSILTAIRYGVALDAVEDAIE
jgi:hypothetical protein